MTNIFLAESSIILCIHQCFLGSWLLVEWFIELWCWPLKWEYQFHILSGQKLLCFLHLSQYIFIWFFAVCVVYKIGQMKDLLWLDRWKFYCDWSDERFIVIGLVHLGLLGSCRVNSGLRSLVAYSLAKWHKL